MKLWIPFLNGLFIIFNYEHVYVSVWVCVGEFKYPQKPEVWDSLELDLTGGCLSPDVGAGSQSWVLWKNAICP